METTKHPAVDKSGWGPGPWQDEPDRKEWKHAGLPCLMSRGPSGHWCGYVAVPPGHPAHGKHYDGVDVNVHGGLTYADKCQGAICHVPEPGDPDDVWWLGFDCAHARDLSPKSRAWEAANGYAPIRDEEYRGVPYVTAETERLAEQLAAMVGEPHA